ncbi:MAG: glycosyltransferase [Trueperaceae bacterium]|nr:glycosyltransferase [Trueperaceae bacterium]
MFSSYFRGYQYNEELLKLGVEVRQIQNLNYRAKKGYQDIPLVDAYKAGQVELDVEPIEWADVVMFRRYYNTALKCKNYRDPQNNGCGFVTMDEEEAKRHEHGYRRQDDITRMLWPHFRDGWDGGLVYETDDNHWEIKPWNGYYGDVIRERDLIADMARRADIMTVAVPKLAQEYGKYNKNVRVVRNAIDPELYVKDAPRPEGDKPRLVYYGSTARLRDYAGRHVGFGDGKGYAYEAVQYHRDKLHRVFLGTNEGTESVIERLFDEQHPYIEGIAAFSKGLANSHGDIGIAPLAGDDFDASKSELHWLEYAMTDMAFIGQRFSGPGPYSVVRNGVDGLLARGAQEWRDAVGQLAKSKDLREQLAGAAKERVLAEYDYRKRAQEWADVFRFAAENPGYGKRRERVAA